MSDTAAAPQAIAVPRPSNWLRTILIILAVIEGLEGLFKLPLLFAGDPDVPGKGWGGWAVTSELALSFPFALIALIFLIRGDMRRAIAFIAGLGLLKWISLLPSLVNHPADFPGAGIMGLF